MYLHMQDVSIREHAAIADTRGFTHAIVSVGQWHSPNACTIESMCGYSINGNALTTVEVESAGSALFTCQDCAYLAGERN